MKRAVISVLLAAHIIAITCWTLPFTTPLLEVVRHAVRPYFVWAGLFQGWDMFAPNPKPVSGYVEAIIIDHDGKAQHWTSPRMHQLGYLERYREERYRKFVEDLQDEKNVAVWPDVARHLAWLHRRDPSPPEIVILVLHWYEIEPHFGGKEEPETWRQKIFYEYSVMPSDLE